MSHKRGALIVLEGVDRCGKTTQSHRLVDSLNQLGHRAVHMRFPDRTTATGKIINEYLTNARNVDDNAVHLLFAANRWEAKAQIEQHLREGTTVVLDRYAYSGAAFSAAKGIDLEWCKDPDRCLPAPDVVLYLKISIDAAMKRGEFGAERYEKESFQRRVKEIFEQDLWDASWTEIDAEGTPEQVQEHLQHEALRVIASIQHDKQQQQHREIGKLWVKHILPVDDS